MTNENMIKQLKRLIPSLQYADDVNAVKGAIKALSQELCEWGKMTFDAISGMSIFEFSDGTVKRVKQAELEPCEDAISRDAVIKIIEDAETARLRGDIDLLYAPILKKLNELTSVNPQPCDDAISRSDMLDAVGHGTTYTSEEVQKIVNNLSPVTPQQKYGEWIPVSERLPEVFSFVNCTCHSLIDDREDWVVETCYLPQLPDSPYSDWGNIPMLNYGDCEVVAWMNRDIPKPYKVEPQERSEKE